MRWAGIILLSILLALPSVGADDVVNDPVCDDTVGCAGGPACVPGVLCQADRCDPVAACASDVSVGRACAVNETIEGRTCQDDASLAVEGGRPAGVGPDVGATRVGAQVVLTEGNVSARHLTNAWMSHGASFEATLLGVDLGTTRVSLYRSVIDLGEDHDELRTFLFPESNHTFSQVGVELRQSALDKWVAVGVFFLDQAPEGCFVATSEPDASSVRCPSSAP